MAFLAFNMTTLKKDRKKMANSSSRAKASDWRSSGLPGLS